MRFHTLSVAVGTFLFSRFAQGQQYQGDAINTTLPGVGGTEITYFHIEDPSGQNNNLTLINYYSHGKDGKRIVESNVRRAVITIHGAANDPGTYMVYARNSLSGVEDPNINYDTVAIMAPFFPNEEDAGKGYPTSDSGESTSNALVWSTDHWSAGGDNIYPSDSTTISSFTVLDQVIQYWDNATLFPNLKQIVVSGHSMGAQMVQRYAAIGAQLETRVPVSYWVGNPNSYAWLSTEHPISTDCDVFDDYREGYNAFTEYPMTYGADLVASGREAVLANWNSRAINYARGLQDHGDVSENCAPSSQGEDRSERFFNFIKQFPPSCPDPAGTNCDTVDYVDVGHDGNAMMTSPAGRARLYEDNFYGNGSRAYDFYYPRVQGGDDPYPDPSQA